VGNGRYLLMFQALGKTSISEPAMAQQNVEGGIVVNQELLTRIICWPHPPDYKTQAHRALLASKRRKSQVCHLCVVVIAI
jgi:hypothetical protein